jgi:hypothetical protein
LALGLAMQFGGPGPSEIPNYQVGGPGPSEMPNYPALPNAYNQYGFEGKFEQRYPFDTQQNWVHGYFQEIPAYGGHVFYRPYNYKDVLSQSQTAAGWGQSPTLPYSQQFWHRYHDQATMLKLSQTSPPVQYAAPATSQVLPAGAWGGAMTAAPVYAAPTGYWQGQTQMQMAPAQAIPLQTMQMQQPVYYAAPVIGPSMTLPPQ